MIHSVYHMDMMRRKDRQQDSAFAKQVLETAPYGILSMIDGDGSPYAIPISFALAGERIYIHGATEGKKLRLIGADGRICFTVVGKTRLLPAQFSTEYESVVVFGTARIVTDEQERHDGLMALARKYSPEFTQEAEAYIARARNETSVIRIDITQMSAKAKLPKPSQTTT